MYTHKSLKNRIIALSVLILLAIVGVTARLYYIQVIAGADLQKKALEQWLRDLPLVAERGTITDRNGMVIASSHSVYDIYVRPVLVEDSEKEARLYSEVLELDLEETLAKITDRSISEILLKKFVSKDNVNKLLDMEVNSFVATENWERDYSYGSTLAQVLGFVGSDGDGQSGLELYYNDYLRGVNGLSLVDSDAKGSEIGEGESYYIPSIDGLNIQTTIDLMIQIEVEKIMANALTSTGAKSTSALVMDPNTGEILAMTTQPSYDIENLDRENLDELYELSRSFCISDTYEPGSTFKTITAAIGLDLGVTSIDTSYFCAGYRMVDGVRTNCHKKTGHGPQTLVSGFYNSCNCVFMQIMSDIGVERFFEYAKKFHFDDYLGIDFPSEATGQIISKDSMMLNDFLRNGFGQSIAVSALQLTSAIGAVVTNGYLMKPYFVSSIYSSTGESVYSQTPTRLNRVVSESIVDDMQYIMSMVVEKGGGGKSKVEGYTVGGKTGTAQKYDNGQVSTNKYIGSYICISPVENPKYIVMVIIDEPKTSIYGNVVATPCAGEILKKIFEIRGDEPMVESEEEETIEIPSLIGKSLTEAGTYLASNDIYYVTEGDGPVVTSQIPKAGEHIGKNDTVVLKFN